MITPLPSGKAPPSSPPPRFVLLHFDQELLRPNKNSLGCCLVSQETVFYPTHYLLLPSSSSILLPFPFPSFLVLLLLLILPSVSIHRFPASNLLLYFPLLSSTRYRSTRSLLHHRTRPNMVAFTDNAWDVRGQDGKDRSHIPPQPLWAGAIRVAELVLAFIVLVLTAYAASHLNSDVSDPPAPIDATLRC